MTGALRAASLPSVYAEEEEEEEREVGPVKKRNFLRPRGFISFFFYFLSFSV